MSLTLANFKQQIDKTILQRGREYLRQGHIVDLDEIDEGHWSAQVEGTDTYEVEVTQDEKGVLTCECDCPYDMGPVCKHIAAVLYAIEEAFPQYAAATSAKPRKKRKTGEEKVHDILKKLTHEQLVDLVAEMAQADRQIMNMILARFSESGSEKKLYSRMVKDALNLGKREYGFIDYWGSGRAAKGIRGLLERAEGMLQQGQPTSAIPILQAVIETVVPVMEQADDSNGELGGVIEDALDMLGEAGKVMPPEERAALFDYLLAEAPQGKYRGWDWGWDLAQIGAALVTTADQRVKLFEMLDTMAGDHRKNRESYQVGYPPSVKLNHFDFDAEQADMVKLHVIERLDGDQAAEGFLKERLHLAHFRQVLVQFHLARGNVKEAKRLTHEYLNASSKQYPGIAQTFEIMLLEIAQKEKDTAEVRRLAQRLFVATANFELYEMLKQATPAGEWGQVVVELVAASKRSDFSGVVAEIYKREEQWEKLLATLKTAHTSAVDHYRKHLEPRFPNEMCDLYEHLALKMIDRQANRQGYQKTCEYLQRMQKLGQGERVSKLVQSLREQYKSRRALLDELKKVEA